ncbi:Breakpoint cluster region protein [Platysternon megacephalum]|uniref:Breakpoint cluster region protein n=1 Tax=Platysternon megacephalum TaxID=55544 RepID=A0A4D9DQB7_9SAUR|nr:Breakpoint cluster region protein [Platysternon megacephalum]
MWEPAEFQRHWQAEFPGEPAPRMQLGSVRDMELELERCRGNLRQLQQALAEEKFKVLYLETALAREPPAPSRDGQAEEPDVPPGKRGAAGRAVHSLAAAIQHQLQQHKPAPRAQRQGRRQPPRREHPVGWSTQEGPHGPATEQGSNAAAGHPPGQTHGSEPPVPVPREAHGSEPPVPPPGQTHGSEPPVPVPRQPPGPRGRAGGSAPGAPPRGPPAPGPRGAHGSEPPVPVPSEPPVPVPSEPPGSDPPVPIPAQDHGSDPPTGHPHGSETIFREVRGRQPHAKNMPGPGEGSVEYEEVDMSVKFLLNPVLLGFRIQPQGCGEEQDRPHHWLPTIGGRWPKHSRELDSLDGTNGRSSPMQHEEQHPLPWRHRRHLDVPGRDSSSCSSPERGSDCSYNSSDHEDGSSADVVALELCVNGFLYKEDLQSPLVERDSRDVR